MSTMIKKDKLHSLPHLTCRALLWLTAALATSAVQAQTTVEYIHTDALGTPVAVTDAGGNVIERSEYAPYGELLNRPLADEPGYTGHVQDAATGLTYMQQRYHDPQIGRFLSVDPVTVSSSSGANFNRYWYANNNPYTFFDPDGRCAGSHIVGIDGKCVSTGEYTATPTAASGGLASSTVPKVPYASAELNRSALNPDAYNSGKKAGEFIENAWEELTERILPAIPMEGQLYAGGIGLLAKFESIAKFNPARASHIFRPAAGHVAPTTAASRARFASLFEQVASNPGNLRSDAVKVGLVTKHAASYGVQGFTQTMSSGRQIWVQVRNGEIINAGVNAAGSGR